MSVAAATAGADPEQGGQGRRRKWPLMIIVAVIVLLAGAVLWFGVLRHGGKPTAKSAGHATPTPAVATVVDTPELIVNLDAGPHRISFAKLQLGIEVLRSSDASAIRVAMPRIVDMTETYLRSVRPEELRSDTGAYLLREALLSRMMIVAPTAQVNQILFEELLVQ